MNCQITEEQRRNIDEKRKQALARRTGKILASPANNNPKQGSSISGPYYGHGIVKGASSSSLSSSNTQHEPKELYCRSKDKNPLALSSLTSKKTTSVSQRPTEPTSWLSKAGSQKDSVKKIKQFYGVPETALMGKCVLTSMDRFAVEVGYHNSLIEFFKQMETRSYDASTKTWSFSLGEYEKLMKGAKVFEPSVCIEGLPQILLQMFRGSHKDDGIPEANLSGVDEKLVNALFSFQKEGVDFGIHHEGKLLLADDMGLGKTLQALCIASYYRKEWPLLVISPSSVRHDWARQICQWLPSVHPEEVNVIDKGKVAITRNAATIISYDLLSKKVGSILEQRFRVIIMDESHFLKNFKAVRTKAALKIVKAAKRVILLSGTPALSRPSELYPQISCVYPKMFKFHDYGVRYCSAKQHPWGWDYSGSSNMAELQLILEKKIMIRRQKKDVLSQLPSKTRQVVFLGTNLTKSNSDLKKTYKIMDGAKLKGAERHGLLLQYFRETCKVKLSAVRDYILDLVEAEKKFLVFAHHKEMLDVIEDAVKLKEKISYIRIDGRTTSEQRSFFCRKFQKSDDYKVAILSITAANAGLNLSAASLVIFAELFWNPGILVQAEDRVHRIGQENAVSIQYLIAQKTADDFIWPLVQDKLAVLSKAGLTRDNFSDADTMRAVDKTQKTILDMFTEDIAERMDTQDSEAEVVPAENDHDSSPFKPPQSSPSPSARKRKKGSKHSADSSSDTPGKRQTNVTNFFPVTPPSKVSKLDSSTGNNGIDSCNHDSSPFKPPQSSPSPFARKRNKGRKHSADSSPDTPGKRQTNITNFFPVTPPSKLAKLDTKTDNNGIDSCSKRLFADSSNLSWVGPSSESDNVNGESSSISETNKVKNHADVSIIETVSNSVENESDNMSLSQEGLKIMSKGSNSMSLSQEDLRIMSEIDWDEEF